MEAALEPSLLSVIPALVAIVLAFLTRQVLPSLFLGVVSASLVLAWQHQDPSQANFVSTLLLPALGSPSYAKVLLIYLWCLGGLIGIWEKTGGALHFAHTVGGKVAKGPRSSMVFSWLLGCIFHQGGTVSTVLAGTTVKPVADKHKVSHEELAYIVDSTASPIATLLPFNAWPAYIAALVVGTVEIFPDDVAGTAFFFKSIPFNFYAMFAVLFTLLFALGWMPWVGPKMKRARERSRATGALDAPGAQPMLVTKDPAVDPLDDRYQGYKPALIDFFLPIGLLLSLTVLPYLIARANWINEAFFACAISAILLSWIRGMPMARVLEGFLNGCKSMTIGALILGLAITLGFAAKELHTADYLVSVIGTGIPLAVLPVALTMLCMTIAFSCGTSWGTYAVVFPVAMPLAWAMHPDPLYLSICFGAVMGGAVFGDQCSPISDTTILSSMFTGCDLMDHVSTQLPMALLAAGLGAIASAAAVILLI